MTFYVLIAPLESKPDRYGEDTCQAKDLYEAFDIMRKKHGSNLRSLGTGRVPEKYRIIKDTSGNLL